MTWVVGTPTDFQTPVAPDHGAREAVSSVERLDGVVTLHAAEPPVHGGLGITLHRHGPSLVEADEKTAAYATETARRLLPLEVGQLLEVLVQVLAKGDARCERGRRSRGRGVEERTEVAVEVELEKADRHSRQREDQQERDDE